VRQQHQIDTAGAGIRGRLIEVWARLAVQRVSLLLDGRRDAGTSPRTASIGKLRMSQTAQALGRLSHAGLGRRGVAWASDDLEAVSPLGAPKYSSGGGTDQVQRNTIAGQLPGLPR
jgi:alkylation response protein AidB-like acyl-CoA dehydrogenase